MSDTVTAELKKRIDAIEGGYELFLSYAAKGARGEPGTGGELRSCLERMDKAMDGLGEFLSGLVRGRPTQPGGTPCHRLRTGRPDRRTFNVRNSKHETRPGCGGS